MKTKIDKSELFKMAWSMYKRSISVLGREFCQSFSACLRNAWFKMKAEARKAEKEARRLMKKSEPAQKPEPVVFDAAMERGITEYYPAYDISEELIKTIAKYGIKKIRIETNLENIDRELSNKKTKETAKFLGGEYTLIQEALETKGNDIMEGF